MADTTWRTRSKRCATSAATGSKRQSKPNGSPDPTKREADNGYWNSHTLLRHRRRPDDPDLGDLVQAPRADRTDADAIDGSGQRREGRPIRRPGRRAGGA